MNTLQTKPRDFAPITIPTLDQNPNKEALGYNDLDNPTQGVFMLASLDPTITIGNYVRLFWVENGNEVEVQDFPVDDTHIKAGYLTFSVLPQYIHAPGGVVYYTIFDLNSGITTPSQRRTVEVKTTLPGGYDPLPSTPINENLAPVLGLPPVIYVAQNLVLTVPAWDNMSAGDVLRLSWGGQIQTEPKLPLSEVNQPQTVTVTAATMEAAGDSDDLVVEYEIRDVANNWSRWSQPARSNVSVDPNAPPAPRVRILIEGQEQDVREIDLGDLGTQDVTLAIPLYPGVADGDVITASWIGRSPDSGDVIPVLEPQTIVNGLLPRFTVLNADVLANAGGKALVRYTVNKGGTLLVSKFVEVTITGQAAQLPPPTLEGAVGNAVDPDTIAVPTVRFALYPGKAFGDVIFLNWSGLTQTGRPFFYSAEHSVLRNEATTDSLLTVPKTNLDALVNGSLTLTYKVLFISTGITSETSPPTIYQVVSGALLPKPTVDNAPNDMFDPDQFTNGTVVHIDGTAARLKYHDEVTAYWEGTPGQGSSSVLFRVAQDNQNLNWTIGPGFVEANRDGTVKVRYEVTREAGGSELSETRSLQIKAAASDIFPKPAVLEAPGDILDPIEGESGVTLRVAYASMQTTDIISISWDGKNTYTTQNGNASGVVTFNIPAADVGAAIGRSIPVFYAVLRGSEPHLSDELPLRVQQIPQDKLEAPKITEAPNDTLDVSTLTGDANLTVKPWPFIAAGQQISLRFEGTAEDGSAYGWSHPTWQNLPITSTATPSTTVALNELQKLKDGSALRLIFEVSFDGGLSKVAFPVRTLTIAAVTEAPTITSVKGTDGAEIPNGSTIMDTSVTLTGTAAKDRQVEIFDGATSLGQTKVDASGNWTLTLDDLDAKAYSIKAKALYGSGAESTVRTFTVVERVTIPISTGTPGEVAITPDGTRAYVCNVGLTSQSVSVINTTTNTVSQTITVGTNPSGIAITPNGFRAYVTNHGASSVSVINTANNSVIKNIAVGINPVGIAITPNGLYAYVCNLNAKSVSVINTTDNTVVKTIIVDFAPREIAITPDGSRAYVSHYATESGSEPHTVSVINVTDNSVIDTITLGLSRLEAIAITPDGSHAYVPCWGSGGNVIWVIHTATNTVIQTIPIESRPFGIAITAANRPNGTRAYVTLNAKIVVINTTTNAVIQTIPVEPNADGIAITPDGTRAYVTSARPDIVSVIPI